MEASVDSALQLPETGFTANCRVFIKQVRDTIVVPQIAIYEEDSLKVVYVKSKKNRYEMRQIITGLSSSKDAIVSHGLKPGEVIALIKPPLSMVRGKTLLGDSTNMKGQLNLSHPGKDCSEFSKTRLYLKYFQAISSK